MGEYDARTSNTRIAQRKRAIGPNTLDDENALQHVTSVLVRRSTVTKLNQPEAFASDLGDDHAVT